MRLFIAVLGAALALACAGAEPLPAGLVLLGELNCAACHPATPSQSAWLSPKSAPKLGDIGQRASAGWLRTYLGSPHEAHPGATMPDLLHGRSAKERADAAEALTHFLLSQSPSRFRRVMPDRAAVGRGEALLHNIGCVACHQPQNTNVTLAGAVPWPRMAEKWSFDGLRRFLLDPLATRPSGRMPALGLSDSEAADLAHYLLRETRVAAPLELATYRGRVRSLEDIDSAELARTGPAESFEVANRDRGSALRFHGWLRIEQPGEYTFFHTATGASRLAVDGQWLTGADSWRREQVDARAALRLESGWHEVTVDFIPRGAKPPALKVEWAGPGVAREVIPAGRLRSEREAGPEPAPFVVDREKAAQGRALFAELNCAACHEQKIPATPPPALAAVNSSRGCLAASPPATAPQFHLEPAQREAVREALAALNQPGLAAPSPSQQLAHALATFRCSACHTRDGAGGVSAARDAWFTSNGEDLGDEGRIPPRLDGVGDKLRPAWLSNVLARGASVRPYMNTRMPQFGAANVAPLAGLFVALDRRAAALPTVTDAPDVLRETGRKLAGTDGLSCIVCHRFNRQPGHTMQVIDLITAPERLNEDWFHRFLSDPNRFNAGTRMPSLWPEGVSLLPEVLGGDTGRQQAALWAYLSEGPRAKFPEGLSRQSLELIVGGEAVVYRGKLWEAGFRAVATGYPGQVNAAFDAEELRLALLWRGRFLNVAPHWTVQGMGQIRPVGTDVVVFPHGPALAVLADPGAAWPTNAPKELGARFRGYQLDALKRPSLLYSFRGVEVEDHAQEIVTEGRTGLRRTLKFTGTPENGLHFRLAEGQLTVSGANAWRLEDKLTLRLPAGTETVWRGDSERRELLVPVKFRAGRSQLEVDYAW